MMQQALQFLQDHNEVAFATSDGHLPKIRMFQIMKQEGTVLYFSTSAEKAVWKELMQNPNVEDEVKRWIYEHNPVLPRLYSSYDQLVYFCLPIAEMDYFNLTPTPPIFKHFDLMVGDVGDGFVGERFKSYK